MRGVLVGCLQCKLVPAVCVSVLWWCWRCMSVNNQLIPYFLLVRYLLRIQQYSVNKKRNRPPSDIWYPTLKICVPGRIITRSSDIRDLTLKKRNRETTKVVSTISAAKCVRVWVGLPIGPYITVINLCYYQKLMMVV